MQKFLKEKNGSVFTIYNENICEDFECVDYSNKCKKYKLPRLLFFVKIADDKIMELFTCEEFYIMGQVFYNKNNSLFIEPNTFSYINSYDYSQSIFERQIELSKGKYKNYIESEVNNILDFFAYCEMLSEKDKDYIAKLNYTVLKRNF